MIIPIRCFTCGNVLADKELAYQTLISQQKKTSGLDFIRDVNALLNKNEEDMKSVEGKVLDQLKVYKMCCRRHMLTSVDALADI